MMSHYKQQNNIFLSILHKLQLLMICPSFFLRNSSSKPCLLQQKHLRNFRKFLIRAIQVFPKMTLMLNQMILLQTTSRIMVMIVRVFFLQLGNRNKYFQLYDDIKHTPFKLSHDSPPTSFKSFQHRKHVCFPHVYSDGHLSNIKC